MSDLTLIPSRFAAVTPSDTTPMSRVIGLHVGGAGNVAACGVDGVVVTFVVTAGTFLRGSFTKVMATGTTSTGIVALFSV